LENTDHRTFESSRKKANSDKKHKDGLDDIDEPDKIDKTIGYFKINDDFTIEKFYKENYKPPSFKDDDAILSLGDEKSITKSKKSISKEDEKNDTFKWSFDISNMQGKNDVSNKHKKNYVPSIVYKKGMQKKNDDEYYILVAISRVSINENMKGPINNNAKKFDHKSEFSKKKFKCSTPLDDHEIEENNKFSEAYDVTVDIQSDLKSEEDFYPSNGNMPNEIKKGVAIYRLELIKEGKGKKENFVLSAVTCYYSDRISGICRFIKVTNKSSLDKQRFVLLNFEGIFSFKPSNNFEFKNKFKKFEYPRNVRRELDNWYTRDPRDHHDPDNCMERLISHIYDKYFLVTQYRNDVQSLEGKPL
jgi:hypothetical protein